MTEERIREFVTECRERLVEADQLLVDLEQASGGDSIVDSLYRHFHTIKGNCGFFGFERLQAITHEAESLIDGLRDGTVPAGGPVIDALLEVVDASRTVLASIEETGEEPESDWGDLIERLERLRTEADSPSAYETTDSWPAPDERTAGDGGGGGSEGPGASSEEQDDDEKPGEPSAGADEVASIGATSTSRSVRVDVELLDRLMNQTSELILSRNRLQRHASLEALDAGFQEALHDLDLLTSELQHSVMQARMQPIRRIWNRLPRMVRDLARRHDKEIELKMQGGATELDKNLVELIADPLTHLVRNAVDHGIESPEARREAGKPESGVVRLSASHERGQVVVQIEDDGRGIDREAVAERAVARGLCTAEELEEASEQQLYELLFEPGFSTRAEATGTSGRGVGLDVVKRHIERAGGAIRVDSTEGAGTTFELYLPLTLAVVSALTIQARDQEFIIPQEYVRHLTRTGWSGDREAQLEVLYQTPVYRDRGRLLPVVYLDRVLGFDERPPIERVDEEANVSLVLLRAERTDFALVVDRVLDTQEHVVKSLPGLLQEIGIYQGATIRGDGRSVMILDPTGLLEAAELAADAGQLDLEEDSPTLQHEEAPEESGPTEEILWCRSRDDGRMAVPLSSVERLEQFERGEIEHHGEVGFVHYEDQLLPLVEVEDVLPERRSEPRNEEVYRRAVGQEDLPVVLHRWGGELVGLIVTEFLDILATDVDDQYDVSRRGVACCTEVRGHITEVLDVATILDDSPLTIGGG